MVEYVSGLHLAATSEATLSQQARYGSNAG